MDSKVVALLILITCLIFTSTPVINSIHPDIGINNQIIEVKIDGGKFNSSTTVKLTRSEEPDIVADNIKLITKNELTCSFDLTNRSVGKWNLVVTNNSKVIKKGKTAILSDSFEIQYPEPILNNISPNTGVVPEITSFKLDGFNFRAGAKVRLRKNLNELKVKDIQVASPQKITGIIDLNNARSGSYDVVIINDDQKKCTLKDGFIVETPIPVKNDVDERTSTDNKEPNNSSMPNISKINPKQGFNNGAILCSVYGSNFQTGLLIKLVSADIQIPGQNIKLNDDEKITCFFDLNQKPVGDYDVIVINPDGQQAFLNNGFEILEFTQAYDDLNAKLKPTFFDFDKAEIRSDQLANLKENINLLIENPELYILIGGHADERGSREYNLDLSARRAEAIKDIFLKSGINTEKVTIYAYGKDYPAKTGHDESSWWFNRRVDIFVYETPPSKEQGLIRSENDLEY